MANASEELDLVLLEAHARPASVAETPARELVRDVFDEDRQTGGQTLDGDHQRRSVGLARRQEPQQPRLHNEFGSRRFYGITMPRPAV